MAQGGQDGLTRIRNLAGRGDGGYDFAAAYPDDELAVIMRGLVEATGRPPLRSSSRSSVWPWSRGCSRSMAFWSILVELHGIPVEHRRRDPPRSQAELARRAAARARSCPQRTGIGDHPVPLEAPSLPACQRESFAGLPPTTRSKWRSRKGGACCGETLNASSPFQARSKALRTASRSIRPSATTRPSTRTTGTRQS